MGQSVPASGQQVALKPHGERNVRRRQNRSNMGQDLQNGAKIGSIAKEYMLCPAF